MSLNNINAALVIIICSIFSLGAFIHNKLWSFGLEKDVVQANVVKKTVTEPGYNFDSQESESVIDTGSDWDRKDWRQVSGRVELSVEKKNLNQAHNPSISSIKKTNFY